MICSECKRFVKIGSNDGVERGICRYMSEYVMVFANSECMFVPEPYKCKDCDHFRIGDTACMTANGDDPVGDCPGFVDNKEVDIIKSMFDWKMRGIDVKQKLETIYEEFLADFEEP